MEPQIDTDEMTNREQLLKSKLAANQQRLARQSYLSKLPLCWSAYLSHCDIVQSPELDEIAKSPELDEIAKSPELDEILKLLRMQPEAIGEDTHQPQGYIYREFSREAQLLAAVRSVDARHDKKEAFFYPSLGNPLYRVQFGWVRNNLEGLFQYGPDELSVVTTDLKTGIIISNYCGQLADDPNPDEIVFQLATWGL